MYYQTFLNFLELCHHFKNKYPTSNMSKEKEALPDQDEFLDCKDCTKTFFTKSGLKIHSRNQHKLKKKSEKKVDQHQQSTTIKEEIATKENTQIENEVKYSLRSLASGSKINQYRQNL